MRPVPPYSLAFFRLALGALLSASAIAHLYRGWAYEYWVRPEHYFAYYGFAWLPRLPGTWMYAPFAAMAAFGLAVSLGWRYRVSAMCLAVLLAYVFLLEKAQYLNQTYAACLLAALLAVVPANAAWSLGRGRPGGRSEPRVVRAWAVWLLRFQVGVIYFFSGLAKTSPEWLSGAPAQVIVRAQAGGTLSGWLGAIPGSVEIITYGGLAIDLLVVPALLWARTRSAAFVIVVAFHGANACLFSIGMYPLLMLVATTIYLSPDWPARFVLSQPHASVPGAPIGAATTRPRRFAIVAASAYVLWQCAMPLRHLAYPGDVDWTEEGQRFAWRMKLNAKAGSVAFGVVREADTLTVYGDEFLTARQVGEVFYHPDMIAQAARWLAAGRPEHEKAVTKVYARAYVALNGRPLASLIDTTVDLSQTRQSLLPASWILPRPH